MLRQACEALCASGSSVADLEYLRILHLAATTLAAAVEAQLRRQLGAYEELLATLPAQEAG